MNFKKTLFFIGKCLTINSVAKNKISIENELKANSTDWDAVVRVSTGHYVLPALYCSLKKANFLDYLPEDLVGYMKYITDLNRDRNQQIIIQAKEINELLLANDISPVFIKGVGNLLEGLYYDIGERMMYDIDFIVSKKNYLKTISILKENGYSELNKNKHPFVHIRHYTRIVKKNRIAALEVHHQLTTNKYSNYFNYNLVSKDIISNNNSEKFISLKNQLCLSIISFYINDNGVLFKSASLKDSYDIFMLSQKTDAKKAVNSIEKINKYLNFYLASSYYLMGKPNSLIYNKNKRTENYIKTFHKYLQKTPKRRIKFLQLYLLVNHKLSNLTRVISDKKMRMWFFELYGNKIKSIGIRNRERS